MKLCWLCHLYQTEAEKWPTTLHFVGHHWKTSSVDNTMLPVTKSSLFKKQQNVPLIEFLQFSLVFILDLGQAMEKHPGGKQCLFWQTASQGGQKAGTGSPEMKDLFSIRWGFRKDRSHRALGNWTIGSSVRTMFSKWHQSVVEEAHSGIMNCVTVVSC